VSLIIETKLKFLSSIGRDGGHSGLFGLCGVGVLGRTATTTSSSLILPHVVVETNVFVLGWMDSAGRVDRTVIDGNMMYTLT